jgi:hypothetical protein
MKQLFSIICFGFLLSVNGQGSNMLENEATLEGLLLELRASKDNFEKEEKNKAFKTELLRVLALPEAFDYPFSKLKTVGVIDSPDKQIRIVNWNIEQDDFSQKYTCYVLYKQKRKEGHQVTELKDISFGMPTQPDGILSADQWYGALYYKIIPMDKGTRTLYTVLAWDYFSDMSQMKMIDVMYVSGNAIKLGNPVFKVGKETFNRVYYEHSKKATMYLNYEGDRNRIMMDHLSPESPSMKDFKSFYVPDLSYDAFVLDGSKWILQEDVIGVNKDPDAKKQVIYVRNEKTGEVEAKEVKVKWQNPEDSEAPAGGSEHVAVTPDELNTKAKEKDAAKQKKDKRDPSELSIFKDLKKSKRKRN